MFAFKGQTADFKKLPPKAKTGFLIEIVGDNQKGQDNYYVQLQTDSNGGQVWKEVGEPNSEKDFDYSTMPHQLIRQPNGSFEFKEADWSERKAGDDDTNPFPSFVDKKLNDIFFTVTALVSCVKRMLSSLKRVLTSTSFRTRSLPLWILGLLTLLFPAIKYLF